MDIRDLLFKMLYCDSTTLIKYTPSNGNVAVKPYELRPTSPQFLDPQYTRDRETPIENDPVVIFPDLPYER